MDLYKFRVEQADGNVVFKADPYAFYSELRPIQHQYFTIYQSLNGLILDG